MSQASVRSAKEERHTAFHEAGHAVAAIILKKRIQVVTIVPDETRGDLGSLHHAPFAIDEFDPKPREVRRAVIVSLAGSIAEGIAKGRRNHRAASSDYESALAYAERLMNGDTEKAASYVNARAPEARRIIEDKLGDRGESGPSTTQERDSQRLAPEADRGPSWTRTANDYCAVLNMPFAARALKAAFRIDATVTSQSYQAVA